MTIQIDETAEIAVTFRRWVTIAHASTCKVENSCQFWHRNWTVFVIRSFDSRFLWQNSSLIAIDARYDSLSIFDKIDQISVRQFTVLDDFSNQLLNTANSSRRLMQVLTRIVSSRTLRRRERHRKHQISSSSQTDRSSAQSYVSISVSEMACRNLLTRRDTRSAEQCTRIHSVSLDARSRSPTAARDYRSKFKYCVCTSANSNSKSIQYLRLWRILNKL